MGEASGQVGGLTGKLPCEKVKALWIGSRWKKLKRRLY